MKALELRIQGMSPMDIARQLNIAPRTVVTYLSEALGMLPPPDLEEVRRLEIARLDAMLNRLWPQVEHGAPDAIRSAILVTQERMKILGGYAATKMDTTVTTQTEADRALADFLAAAKAEMELRETQILDAEVVDSDGS